MTQAEMFTRAIRFQNQYIAIDTAFTGSGWTEESKIGKVFSQYGRDYPGGLNECRELAKFIKEKAGDIADRGALIKARNDYMKDLEKASNDANAELEKNSDEEIKKAEANVAVAEKKTNVAKAKRNGNRLLKGALLTMCIIAALSGSLAVFAPLINGVAALLGGLSTAAAATLGLGLWYYGPNIKKWWKEKGKKKFAGEGLKKGYEEALKNEKTAKSELSNKRNAQKAAIKEAAKKADEYEAEANIITNNQFNPRARNAINKLEATWRDLLVQSEASFVKHDWAIADGRQWFAHACTILEAAYTSGKITDENYETVLPAMDRDYGVGGMFDPDVTTPPIYNKFNRGSLASIVPTDAERTEEEFWASF